MRGYNIRGDCISMNKAKYICNCIDYSDIFDNATDMAQVIEKSQEISRTDFYKAVEVLSEYSRIKAVEYRQIKNLFILYDIKKDIHYFYIT